MEAEVSLSCSQDAQSVEFKPPNFFM